ncbi:hypothetical protein OCS_03865 [Ophiocordyceps sinensis CO18]|nr:hypothetical protein OCS_03865 [Ophiocordyceps sinensis CO18]
MYLALAGERPLLFLRWICVYQRRNDSTNHVGMTARTTSDIDIAVPNGAHGIGTLFDIFSKPPFIQDKTGVLPPDSRYFLVESGGTFVEVDAIIAGFMAFPTIEQAGIVRLGREMQLSFLEPAGLLML